MSPEKEKKRDEALAERLMRRVLESMGSVVDRKLGREADAAGRLHHLEAHRADEAPDRRARARRRPQGAHRPAPSQAQDRVGHALRSADPKPLKSLEHEVLAAAIDYINDQRLRTLAPVKIETVVDIFTTGIAVDPTFGEFEEELKQQDEAERRAQARPTTSPIPKALTPQDVPRHGARHPARRRARTPLSLPARRAAHERRARLRQ